MAMKQKLKQYGENALYGIIIGIAYLLTVILAAVTLVIMFAGC